MPRIVRAMKSDGPYPLIGASKKALGAEIGSGRNHDLGVDANSFVRPETGGMSVSPTWRDLPGHRIPRRLRVLCPKATGNDLFDCWQFGDGAFIDGAVTDELSLRTDHLTHGVVEPSYDMPADNYQAALASTRESWSLIPETVRTNEALA